MNLNFRATLKVQENAINRLINQQMKAQHIPGLALAVTQGDKILYAKGYGVASSSQPESAVYCACGTGNRQGMEFHCGDRF